jgi:hypothetical protein
MCDFFYDSLEDKIVFIISFRVEGRPVAISTSSRSSISGLSTKRLASTLNDIIYYLVMDYVEICPKSSQ